MNNRGICCHVAAGICKVLIGGGNCGVCSFHQTAKVLADSKAKAAARLRSLPRDQQMYIADKYHDSRMPWTEATNV